MEAVTEQCFACTYWFLVEEMEFMSMNPPEDTRYIWLCVHCNKKVEDAYNEIKRKTNEDQKEIH
jgi:hypothetical protein